MEKTPLQIDYARPPAPVRLTRPLWLTLLRAGGVTASGIVGGLGGYVVAVTAAVLLTCCAEASNPNWDWIARGSEAVLIAFVGLAGTSCGAVIGVRFALRICRKYPQWAPVDGARPGSMRWAEGPTPMTSDTEKTPT